MYEFYPLWKHKFTGAILLGILIIFVTVMMVTNGAKVNPFTTTQTLTAGGVLSGTLLVTTTIQAIARYILRRGIFHSHFVILRDGHTTNVVFRYGSGIASKLLKLWDVIPKEGEIRPLLSESEKLLGKAAPRVTLNNLDPYIFVTFKRQGTLKSWESRASLLLWLAGLKRWQWCELEWLNDDQHNTRTGMRNLLRHELEHTMIARSYPMWEESMHHRVMEFSRMEEVLEDHNG